VVYQASREELETKTTSYSATPLALGKVIGGMALTATPILSGRSKPASPPEHNAPEPPVLVIGVVSAMSGNGRIKQAGWSVSITCISIRSV
jgi:hypothetical protein